MRWPFGDEADVLHFLSVHFETEELLEALRELCLNGDVLNAQHLLEKTKRRRHLVDAADRENNGSTALRLLR